MNMKKRQKKKRWIERKPNVGRFPRFDLVRNVDDVVSEGRIIERERENEDKDAKCGLAQEKNKDVVLWSRI